ncbi:hypothetical protein [uncultured Christiangramia sp.]|uniref:WD40/YVTN/BNR-like repeat-containing protein n=1 Tax=uncultured Christiangramia sp. TaxID=503836 RepID=UPI003457664B
MTDNAGNTWNPIFDSQPTYSIGSVDIDPSNPSIIWVGSGENVGGRHVGYGDGVYKSSDGGKTWNLVAEGQEPGYRSSIKFVPGGDGEELVAVGFEGIDYSKDGGETWSELSEEGFFTIRFINDSTAYAAGSGRVAKLRFK